MTSETTTYPTGQAFETTWSYNSNEMPIEQDDYDIGGSTLRKTVTNYQQISPSYIVNLPCQVIIYSDAAKTARRAETDYFYDNGATATPCGAAGTPSVVGAGGSTLTNHDETLYSATATTPRGISHRRRSG
jgi:hypothetical protein